MHGVEQAQPLGGAFAQVMAVSLEGLHAANIYIAQIHRRQAVPDPVHQHLADPARALNADGVESAGDEQIADFRGFAEEIAIIRREAFGAIEKGLDTGFGEDRQALDCALQDRLEMVKIFRQAVKFEILGDAIHAPGLALGSNARAEACRHPPCNRHIHR